MRNQRTVAAILAATLVAGFAAAAPASAATRGDEARITVMETSDLHGNALNWDYFRNAEYDDTAHDDVGLAKVSTLVNQIRADRGRANTMLVDSGDPTQGTPLDYYYAKVEPFTETGETHPMAKAMNAIGYDAVSLGNHEFTYGVPLLAAWIKQVQPPVLGANAVDARTGVPKYLPFVMKTVRTGHHRPVRVGVLGLPGPASSIWGK